MASYTIVEKLYERGGTAIYRAIRDVDCVPVVLKTVDPRTSRPRDLERLRHDYEIGKTLSSDSVVRYLALESHEGMPTLVMEDFGGLPLDRLLPSGEPVPIERFLALAV